MKLSVKLPLIALFLGGIIGAIFIATQIVTLQQKSDGLVINIAGRQRALSQKMTKEVYQCQSKIAAGKDGAACKASLENTMKVFSASLSALLDGEDAPVTTDLKTTALVKCPKPDEETKLLLQKALSEWKSFEADLTGAVQSNFAAGEVWDKIDAENMVVFKASEAVVAHVQKNSESRVQLLIIIQLIGLCLGIAAIIWTILVVKAVLTKIRKADTLTQEFSSGDLTQRMLVPQIVDELDGSLANVNKLGENIAGIVSQIYSANATLVSVSQEVNKTFDKIANNATSVRNQSFTVAAASEEASANVSSIVASTEELSSTINSIAAAMEEMSATVNEISKNCQEESNIAQKAAKQSAETGEAMERLGFSAQEIGRIISVINDIADQTNLLALNATIEAASAGDAGKGFAVVANEVKELARLTSKATSEITEQIEAMQTDTKASVESMKAISKVISDVNDISIVITSAVEEQSATISEIARNVSESSIAATEISGNVSEISLGVKEVSKNIQNVNSETGSVADAITAAAPDVAKLAALGLELRSIVSTFKIQAAFIAWSEEYSVKVPLMDEQHKKLIVLINELNSAVSAGNNKTAVEQTLQKLIDYAAVHFAEEEKLMQDAGYPDLNAHKPIHISFVDKVVSLQNAFLAGKAMVGSDIMIFLKDWLIQHIMGTDKKYGSAVSKKK